MAGSSSSPLGISGTIPTTRVSSRAPSPTRSAVPPSLRHVSSFSSLRKASKSKLASPARSAQISNSPPPMPPLSTQLTSLALPPHLSVNSPDVAKPIESSASSASGLNHTAGEGIGLLREPDTDVEPEIGDGEDGEAIGQVEAPEDDARKSLRDQLRRTLNQRGYSGDGSGRDTRFLSPKAQGKQPLVEELDINISETLHKPRQYFVLTDAGKPVFCSSPLSQDSDALSSTMGLMQALISVFIDDGDKLRHINAGKTRISFLIRSPIYLACVSDWGEPESVTRSHLEYLHLQVLSVVSGAQLKRIFEKRTNFDLRRLLNGTETFLHSLLARLEGDLAISTSSLACLPLDPTLRSKTAHAIIPNKMKDILYVLLVARGSVITLVRPKKHSVHPSDLHILLNTIHAPAVFESQASWLPICLPRYNANGFLHVYVSFPRHGELIVPLPPPMVQPQAPIVEHEVSAKSSQSKNSFSPPVATVPGPDSPDQSPLVAQGDKSTEPSSSLSTSPPRSLLPPQNSDSLKGHIGLGIVCVSGGGDFETIRGWCDKVTKSLDSDHILDQIHQSIRKGRCHYTASSLGIPGLRHFVYKSRAHVQVTYPIWDEEYDDVEARRRLVTLYQCIHDAIHGKSGQKETLKLQYVKTKGESVMGWITQTFELYVSISPRLPKSAVINAANAVVKWVKREENRLFLRDAPVF